MATYDDKQLAPSQWVISAEYPMYGSSRLGVYNQSIYDPLQSTNVDDPSWLGSYQRVMRLKNYELSDHLGNVLTVISDWKIGNVDGNGNFKYYSADVASAIDYYPFGMQMPGRLYNNASYRFGYQKQEKDDEIYGVGNALSFKYRMEDDRAGRFFSVDPLSAKYPWNSPYAFAENRVIQYIELEGAEVAEPPSMTGTDYHPAIDAVGQSALNLEVIQAHEDAMHWADYHAKVNLYRGELKTGGVRGSEDFQITYQNVKLASQIANPLHDIAVKKRNGEQITNFDIGVAAISFVPADKLFVWGGRQLLRSNMIKAGVKIAEGMHVHHIITYTMGGNHALTQLAGKAGFDINAVENGMALASDFHIQLEEGNFHNKYSAYIGKELDEAYKRLKSSGKLNPENAYKAIQGIIKNTKEMIKDGIKNGAKTLDQTVK